MPKISKNIRNFINLPFNEKSLFLEAIFTLAVMRVAILRFSFKYLSRKLHLISSNDKCKELSENELKVAIIIGEIIEKSANHTPWESACLVKAFTAYKMLKRRGISGCLYIGVAKDETNKTLQAHAWSVVDNNNILTGKSYQNFKILTIYQW
ncbi:MAG: lasso peptide biosynthesis B2 protein [Campylobacterota bacterium]|nr:lasso peptide biosynthesis B2 protein [Campylobacterota bacterium]